MGRGEEVEENILNAVEDDRSKSEYYSTLQV